MQRTRSVRYSSSLSLEAVSLIKGLLQNDPSRRPTLNQVKRHRFFADVDWVRVARKEPHPDGLAQFVADKSQKDSVIAKLATARVQQMSNDNISTSTIVPSDCPEVNSTTWISTFCATSTRRNGVTSVSARTRTSLRPRNSRRPAWQRQVHGNLGDRAWAWTCRDGSGVPLQGLTQLDPRGDSGAFLSTRRSLPERVISARAIDRTEYVGGNDLNGYGRASLQEHHHEVPPSPFRLAGRAVSAVVRSRKKRMPTVTEIR